MSPYLLGGSSMSFKKPLIIFAGTNPEYSVEDYVIAGTANLILKIGPEPVNMLLHQNWILSRTAVIQTKLDGAIYEVFSVLPIDFKSDWKRFTQNFFKMLTEKNEQHQRVICNKVRRLANETFEQLAVRIKTLIRKEYSDDTHDYKNTKNTEVLMMTRTLQPQK